MIFELLSADRGRVIINRSCCATTIPRSRRADHVALESSAIRAVAIVDLVIAAGSVRDEVNRRRVFSVGEGSSGDLPIILSAPHGGSLQTEGAVVVRKER